MSVIFNFYKLCLSPKWVKEFRCSMSKNSNCGTWNVYFVTKHTLMGRRARESPIYYYYIYNWTIILYNSMDILNCIELLLQQPYILLSEGKQFSTILILSLITTACRCVINHVEAQMGGERIVFPLKAWTRPKIYSLIKPNTFYVHVLCW